MIATVQVRYFIHTSHSDALSLTAGKNCYGVCDLCKCDISFSRSKSILGNSRKMEKIVGFFENREILLASREAWIMHYAAFFYKSWTRKYEIVKSWTWNERNFTSSRVVNSKGWRKRTVFSSRELVITSSRDQKNTHKSWSREFTSSRSRNYQFIILKERSINVFSLWYITVQNITTCMHKLR